LRYDSAAFALMLEEYIKYDFGREEEHDEGCRAKFQEDQELDSLTAL
jgi:hypothetical protein